MLGYSKNEQLPQVSFNYLGQFDVKKIVAVEEQWSICKEDSGRTISPKNRDKNILNINGMIIEGTLRFNIESKLSMEDTSRFKELLQSKLIAVVDHTTSQQRNYNTVSDIGKIISAEYLDKIQKNKEISGVYLANSLQQGFIYHALNQGEKDDAYLVQIIWEYKNVMEVEKLKAAWSYAQEKFGALRLSFCWDEELVQIISRQGKLDWRYIDLSSQNDSKTRKKQIKKYRLATKILLY